MSVHELVSDEAWIYATLANDTQLSTSAPGGVFAYLAPDGTTTPYVVFSLQSPGNDSLTMNAVRLLTNPLYQVVAVGESSKMSDIVAAASRIDDLMKRTSGTVTGGYIAACYREQPVQKAEIINTVIWRSLGGLYRLASEQTT